MSRLSGVILTTLALFGLIALAPVGASARGGGGGGHVVGGAHPSSAGGHFSGAHFGGAQFVGGARHVAGPQFVPGGGHVVANGHFGGWPGPVHHFVRHFAGVYGPNIGIYPGYSDAPDYADAPDYSDTSGYYDPGADNAPTCVWARRLVPTYYGLRWQLVPVCYGY